MILILSTGCSKYYIYDDLSWLDTIEFSEETKSWLMDRSPWPDYVKEDLNKIANLNDTIKAIKNIQ